MSESKTFEGGIHPPEYKEYTDKLAIETVPLPEEIFVPLHQHTGAPCQAMVEPDQEVLRGQKIGDADGFITAPVHSPVTGRVVALEERLSFNGQKVMGAVIAVGSAEDQARTALMEALPDWENAEVDDIRKLVREAGIVGLGGAAFPAHVKLSPPPDKSIDTVIINACECEPFLTCDHRLLLEEAEDMLTGSLIMKKAVGASKVIIGIEDNKPDAVQHMQKLTSDMADVTVEELPTKYPQGAEKQLIKALLDREVPSGGLPMDVGALVHNVGTAIAVARAVTQGEPLMERVLTVSGPAVAGHANLKVAIGTPIGHVLDHVGGLKDNVVRLVMGGPMTGFAQSSLEVPVVKGTSGLLALDENICRLSDSYLDCVRCKRCVDACPMFLYPNFLGVAGEYGQVNRLEAFDVLDCVECGACAYVCPSQRPMVRFMRQGKALVWEKQG